MLTGRAFRLLASLSVLAALWGCGGGGGAPVSSSMVVADPPRESPRLPPDVPQIAYLFVDTFRPGPPVMTFGDALHVGADVAPQTESLASGGSMRSGVALSKGHVRDGVGAEDVAAWLRVAASHNLAGDVTGLATYHDDPPPTFVTLMFGEETRNRFTRFARLTRDAVGIVNTGLPFERQIRFNPHISQDVHLIPGSPDFRTYGEILVWFIPKADPRYPEGADPAELGRTKVFFNPEDLTADIWEVDEEGAAYASVLIDPEAVASLSDADVTHLLIHELLHALGFVSHTDPARFASVLNDAGFYPGTQPRSLIYPVDREGLQAAYSRLKPGMSPDEISADSLGTMELPGTDHGHGYVWTGEDLGTVTGAFFGPDHEGMGGVLERHDLSAAFGGRR